jgi:hypothetical protein
MGDQSQRKRWMGTTETATARADLSTVAPAWRPPRKRARRGGSVVFIARPHAAVANAVRSSFLFGRTTGSPNGVTSRREA